MIADSLVAVILYPTVWCLVKCLGCPCCGPRWYRSYIRWTLTKCKQPIPPELER